MEDFVLASTIQGEVKAQILCGQAIVKTLEKPNAVLANSNRIISRLLARDTNPENNIDRIILYLAGNIVAVQPIAPSDIIPDFSVPGQSKVTFKALFTEGSFSGTFDTLELASKNIGPFSKCVLTAPLGKTGSEQALIIWKLTII